jgi:hypothetical protein
VLYSRQNEYLHPVHIPFALSVLDFSFSAIFCPFMNHEFNFLILFSHFHTNYRDALPAVIIIVWVNTGAIKYGAHFFLDI